MLYRWDMGLLQRWILQYSWMGCDVVWFGRWVPLSWRKQWRHYTYYSISACLPVYTVSWCGILWNQYCNLILSQYFVAFCLVIWFVTLELLQPLDSHDLVADCFKLVGKSAFSLSSLPPPLSLCLSLLCQCTDLFHSHKNTLSCHSIFSGIQFPHRRLLRFSVWARSCEVFMTFLFLVIFPQYWLSLAHLKQYNCLPFILQVMHTTFKNVELLKHF